MTGKISLALHIGAIVVVAGIACGWTRGDDQQGQQRSQSEALRNLPNEAFGFGETLQFNVSYGFITAGTATMAVTAVPEYIENHECYHVKFDVTSKSSFDWLYKVRDHYDTYIDVDGIFPWKFEQHVHEGGYARDFRATFDQKMHIAHTTDDNQSYPIPAYVHDILSAYYFVRTLDLKSMHKDDKIHLQNFYKDKVHDVDVRILGRERVEVDAGTFDCVVVEPLVTEGGLFKHAGRIIIWMTDDDRKIPVKVNTKVVIGSIDATLTSYSGIRGPIAAKVE